MRSRIATSCVLIALLLVGGQLFGQSSPTALNPSNPPAFQQYAAPVSSRLAFMASEKGKQTLLSSPNSIAKTFLERYWGADVAAQWDTTPHKYLPRESPSPAPFRPQSNAVPRLGIRLASPTARCAATRFNLEPAANALPQNDESIAFKFGGGSSTLADMAVEVSDDFRGLFLNPAVWSPGISGYDYIDTAGCTPRVEGATPPVPDPLHSGRNLVGAGDPIINYDSNHDAWFYSSLYLSPFEGGIGVFRNTTANLKSANCPSGTHNLTTAASCWPKAVIVDERNGSSYLDEPDSWVDTRATGAGAGDVYISDTVFSYAVSTIDLVVCTNTLLSCSSPVTISGADNAAQFSDIKTAANGTITITYGNFYSITTATLPIYAVDIKYVVCTPNGAPYAPTCNGPVLVATDYAPIVDGLASLIGVWNRTHPVHVETSSGSYVFWEHCGSFSDLPSGSNTVCPDADIVGSVNTGAGWSAPFVVDNAYGHQIQPWVTYDSGADKVVIAYQDCDSSGKTACRAGYRTITPTTGGSETVSAFNPVSSYAYPQDEANNGFLPLFGDHIGASAHDGHAWFGFTDTSRLGLYGYGSASINESNNNIAAWDNP